jgi:hypothetical protein
MAQSHQKAPSNPTASTSIQPPVVQPPVAASAGPKHHALNSMKPGSPEALRPPPDLSGLTRLGYTLYPVEEINVLYSAAKNAPDAPLSAQKQGGAGYDAVLSGTFTVDYVQSAGPIVRDGKMDTMGHAKATHRGGMAVLQDGTVVVKRAQGRSEGAIQKHFGEDGNPVKDFMGGGALLVENGMAVSNQDLLQVQRFDQGGGGIRAQQMRATHHVLVGIRDGQAFAIVAEGKSGAQMQSELLAAGFDAVVKYDGGSGGYSRDGAGGAAEHRGTNSTGLGVRTR